MPPEEKTAMEFINKFYHGIYMIILAEKEPAWKASKQCALICIEEIINDQNNHYYELGSANDIEFYKKVQEEINKL